MTSPLNKIDEAQALAADITQLNFNVTYEVGFALARGKRVVITRHKGLKGSPPFVADVGIFDTLGYLEYQNADELEAIIRKITDPSPSLKNVYPLNTNAPLFYETFGFYLTNCGCGIISNKRVGDFINRPPMVYQLLRNRIFFQSDLGLR